MESDGGHGGGGFGLCCVGGVGFTDGEGFGRWVGGDGVGCVVWCSPLVVVGHCAFLLSARAHTVAPHYSECCHCQSRSCSLSRQGLGGHTNSSRWATFHIREKSRVVLSSPYPRNGLKREVD